MCPLSIYVCMHVVCSLYVWSLYGACNAAIIKFEFGKSVLRSLAYPLVSPSSNSFFEHSKLEIGNWKLETGDQRLEIGDGDWRLKSKMKEDGASKTSTVTYI